MSDLNFLKDLEKTANSLEDVSSDSSPPKHWTHSGNYVLNSIISGNFEQGYPCGRVLGFMGPSGAGKSFLTANALREAQQDGAFVVVIDTENAMDASFLSKIGVDVEHNFNYKGVVTIDSCVKLLSTIIKGYKKQYKDDYESGKKLVILVDSLDMLLTTTEDENFTRGIQRGDQGQRNKQLKAMLRTLVQSIKGTNITIFVTGQVYPNQDMLNGEGKYIVSEAVKYSLSQYVMITKLKLKDGEKNITGIRMKVTADKTRFTKPFQSVTIEVPYETGMDPYSGLLDAAVDAGIVKQAGAWYTLISTEEKFQRKNALDIYPKIIEEFNKTNDLYLNADVSDEEFDQEIETEESVAKKRLANRARLEESGADVII
jgi:recombination protein RecA